MVLLKLLLVLVGMLLGFLRWLTRLERMKHFMRIAAMPLLLNGCIILGDWPGAPDGTGNGGEGNTAILPAPETP